MKDIGEIIREKRLAAGLSQAELADRVQCSRQAIKKWEEGAGESIGLPFLRALASVFRCSVASLIGEDASGSPSRLTAEQDVPAYQSEQARLFASLTARQRDQLLQQMRQMADENERLFEELSQSRQSLPSSRPGFRLGGAIVESATPAPKKRPKSA